MVQTMDGGADLTAMCGATVSVRLTEHDRIAAVSDSAEVRALFGDPDRVDFTLNLRRPR